MTQCWCFLQYTTGKTHSKTSDCETPGWSFSPWVLGLEPVEQRVLVEGGRGGTVAAVALDVGDGV